MPLDEKALRKPGFIEGVPIPLGDGNEWHFREPVFEYVPVAIEGGGFALGGGRRTLGKEFESLLDKLVEANDGVEQANALLNLTVAVLGFNYALGLTEIQTLLPFRPTDETNQQMWRRIGAVMLGDDEGKASAGGSDAV